VAVLLIPDWCLEGEQFDIALLENCRWTSRHEYVLRQPDDAKGILIVDQRTEICVISLSGCQRNRNDCRSQTQTLSGRGDSDKRRRQEEALDEALENTFPASDPVSAEQPTTSGAPVVPDLKT
jgi:hypothetical protein